MTDKIDWSIAPKWAVDVRRRPSDCILYWTDGNFCVLGFDDYSPLTLTSKCTWPIIEKRPEPMFKNFRLPNERTEWTGEGLPPVGSICEVAKLEPALVEVLKHSTNNTNQKITACRVIREGDGDTGKLTWVFTKDLKPVQSERDRISGLAVKFLSENSWPVSEIAIKELYDAGFLKEPTK